MPKGTKYSESEITHHLSQYKSSNLSVSKYCRIHNIACSTFHGWKKRFNQSQAPLPLVSQKDFIKLPVSNLPMESSDGCIKFSHTSVELLGNVSSSLVQNILSTLQNNLKKL